MDTVDIFGAPPPGVDLSDDQSGTVLAPIVIVLVLAIVAVALRFTTRHVVEAQRMAADDVFIIFALLFGFGTAGCVFAALSFGCGKHIWVITLDQFKHIQQVVYAAAQIYAATVTCTKTSIVLYYRRIFDFTTTFWVLEFLIVSYFITIVTVMNTGCHPTNYMWMQYVDPNAKGECVDLLKFYYANAIAATLIDIFILITPIYPVWKLQMPTTKKIAVSGIFLLGGVVIGASIARICTLLKMATMKDQSWGICSGLIWTCLEPLVGIFSACLPTLGPLVRHCSGKISSHLSQSCENGMSNGNHQSYSSSSAPPRYSAKSKPVQRSVPIEPDEYELRSSEGLTAHRTNSVRTSEDTDMHSGVFVTQDLSLADRK
ncbi:hypothetical protein SLS55_010669 [Diplodia seriata]|uniref:Rhodopsin domain-containing protein n=1 Tax=Diplodia seriata TaxID=420778 RepID=A0ABR3BX73_9PEZI